MNFLNQFKISTRLFFTLLFLICVIVAQGVIATIYIQELFQDAKESHDNTTVPNKLIGQIIAKMSDNRSQIFAALQHNPERPEFKLHNHKIDMHLDRISNNVSEITALISEYQKHSMDEEEKRLFEEFTSLRQTFVSNILKTKTLINEEEWWEATMTIPAMNGSFGKAEEASHKLYEYLDKKVTSELQRKEDVFSWVIRTTYIMVGIVVFASILVGYLISRSIKNQILQLATL